MEIKEKIINNLEEEKEDRHKKYETNCGFCGTKFITETHTANEGICYSCRCY